MFRLSLLAAIVASAAAFAPGSMLPTRGVIRAAKCGPVMQQTTKLTRFTPALFTQLDKDGNGTIDLAELQAASGYTDSDIKALFAKADVDGSGDIDYNEYERLMNMERYGDALGGSNDLRFALDSNLVQPDSPLINSLMVGNKGFDPVGFAKTPELLDQYRSAELKHGRLAMLAAVGWPISEYLNPIISKALGSPELLAAGGKAPSLLNGGLERVNPLFFIGTLAFTAFVEQSGKDKGREPGDLGFDPLNLYYGSTEDVKYSYRLKELNNGRLAMIAIATYAFQEFFTGVNVVSETGKIAAPFVTGQPIVL